MKFGMWLFDAPHIVIKQHKGIVRGFTYCKDEWYAEKIAEIKKDL